MKLLYLLVDTELLDFVVDKVDFPEGIERHEHEGNNHRDGGCAGLNSQQGAADAATATPVFWGAVESTVARW